MPIHTWVDRAHRLRRSTAFGVVTNRELLDVYGGMAMDPLADPTLDHLADFTDVQRFEVTPDGLRDIAEMMSRRVDPGLTWAGAQSKVALVARADDVFGMLRMYQSYREAQGSPARFSVFRTLEEARRWLGMPESNDPVPAEHARREARP